MEILTVKLDASAVQEALAKYLEPGAVLLSAEAVAKFADDAGFDSVEDAVEMMVSVGGVYGNGVQAGD